MQQNLEKSNCFFESLDRGVVAFVFTKSICLIALEKESFLGDLYVLESCVLRLQLDIFLEFLNSNSDRNTICFV